MKKDGQKQKGNKDYIFPSTFIAVEEEVLPGRGTYLEDHQVRSAVYGEQSIDKRYYRARVYPVMRGRSKPKIGDEVIGQIVIVNPSSVKLNIMYHAGKEIDPPYSAVMHISDASRDYLKSLDDVYARGDFVRALIIDAKSYPLQLECKKANNGVIITFCDKCGEEVEKIKRNLLKCLSCGWKQSRLTAIDYGKVKL